MNFMYLARFSTSSAMKLVVEDDVVDDETSYGRTNMTSLFSTVPLSSLFPRSYIVLGFP